MEVLTIHISDPPVIKELKALGNIILSDNASNQKAWRLDFAEFFERYVQYLVHTVALRKGAHDLANPKYSISGSGLPKWSLRYLEPDIVLHKDRFQYVIDAKYKSHIYNVGNNTTTCATYSGMTCTSCWPTVPSPPLRKSSDSWCIQQRCLQNAHCTSAAPSMA